MGNKYIIIFISFLFLGACGPDKLAEENQSEQIENTDENIENVGKNMENVDDENMEKKSDTKMNEGGETLPVSVNPSKPKQLILPPNTQQAGFDIVWTCLKDQMTVSYSVVNQPGISDDKGNLILCQLFKTENGKKDLLYYANNERDFCSNKITELAENRVSAGWSCSEESQ